MSRNRSPRCVQYSWSKSRARTITSTNDTRDAAAAVRINTSNYASRRKISTCAVFFFYFLYNKLAVNRVQSYNRYAVRLKRAPSMQMQWVEIRIEWAHLRGPFSFVKVGSYVGPSSFYLFDCVIFWCFYFVLGVY